uniref:SRR1 domain containing n=1 Tax=Jaculus jaculus TaxID=51337 RepID=A0A8C5L4E9_JACJA
MAAAAREFSWQAAAPRRRRAVGRRSRRGEAEPGGFRAEPEADGGGVLRRLREAEEDLRISDFWSSALETISQCLRKQREQLTATLPEALGGLSLGSSAGPGGGERPAAAAGTGCVKCVCYGIGNFASCGIARTQLAFLLLLLGKCGVPRSHCCVYDPVLSPAETEVLAALGVTVLGENEEGKRSVRGERTVFYMPHCGTALYNNLLWSNWSVDALSRILIVGNSFRGLEERLLTKILQKSYRYLAQVPISVEGLGWDMGQSHHCSFT